MKRLSWLIVLVLASTAAFAKTEEKTCEAQLAAGYAEVSPAAKRFRTFFHEIGKGLFEREFFLDISKLALLANENILMLGPPGNAKSMGVDMIINNIVDNDGEPSVFKIQMTPETSLSETHGVIDYKKITEENIQTRMWEQGMLSARLVFIDEFFDARANAIRNTLMALNEREHAQGRERIKGVTETTWVASNKYINEVYDKAGDDGPKATIDRFAFVAFVPGEMESLESAIRLVTEFRPQQPTKMTFDQLDQLRAKVEGVEIPAYVAQMLSVMFMRMKDQTESLEESEKKRFLDQRKAGLTPLPPYRATKYYTPRTLRKAGKILRAIVVNDWIEKEGARPLRANSEDIAQLVKFFTMNSQSEEFLRRMEDSTVNPNEKVQIMSVLKEREMFRDIYAEILGRVNEEATLLTDLEYERENAITPRLKEEVTRKVVETFFAKALEHVSARALRETTEADIAAGYVLSTLEIWLREDLGERFVSEVEKPLNTMIRERDRLIREERQKEETRLRLAEEARVAEEVRARLAEKERAERIARFAVTRETLEQTSPTNLLYWSRHVQALSVTKRDANTLEIFGIEGYQPHIALINLKTGKVMRDKSYSSQLLSAVEQVVRLENGDYLIKSNNNVVHRWIAAKGRLSPEITLPAHDPYEVTAISANAPGNKVWMVRHNPYNDNSWKIGIADAADLTKVKWIEESKFQFESSFPRLDAPTVFKYDMANQQGRLVVDADGKKARIYVAAGNARHPITYEIDTARKKIKVLKYFESQEDQSARNGLDATIAYPAEKNRHLELINDNVIFLGDDRIETQLPQNLRQMLDNQRSWDIAPDESFAVTNHGQNIYGLDFAQNNYFSINLRSNLRSSFLRFIDQNHLILMSQDGVELVRLPTADK